MGIALSLEGIGFFALEAVFEEVSADDFFRVQRTLVELQELGVKLDYCLQCQSSSWQKDLKGKFFEVFEKNLELPEKLVREILYLDEDRVLDCNTKINEEVIKLLKSRVLARFNDGAGTLVKLEKKGGE